MQEKDNNLYNSLKYLEGVLRQLENVLEQFTRVQTASKSYAIYAGDENFKKDVGDDTKRDVANISALMGMVEGRAEREIGLISAKKELVEASIRFLKQKLIEAGDPRVRSD